MAKSPEDDVQDAGTEEGPTPDSEGPTSEAPSSDSEGPTPEGPSSDSEPDSAADEPSSEGASSEGDRVGGVVDEARGDAGSAKDGGAAESGSPSGSDAAADADALVLRENTPRPEIEAEEEPYREGWFFDNPSLGRAIRYTFAEKRLARAVFVNSLFLVVILALVQELFGRAQLGLFHQNISYGRLAFLGLVLVEAGVVSILAPLGFLNVFESERREECFDQVVVSGASPHRVIFGRFVATLCFLAVVLFSSLPFFLTTVVLDGATFAQVGVAYLMLFAYGTALAAITAAVAVALDDTGLPIVIAILALVVVFAAGFSRRGPPEFAAWSPARHVVVQYNDIAQGLRLGVRKPPAPFGVSLPAEVVGLSYYLVLTLLGLGYAFVGPDLELTSGLDSFDSVATSRQAEARRARRGLARTLLRTVQIRFFYENLSDRAQALSPLIRAAATVALFAGTHVVILSAVWPHSAPKAFDAIRRSTAYPYLGFCAFSLVMLALAGAGARSSLLARNPVKLGPLALSRFMTLFVIFALALALPPLLWIGATAGAGYEQTLSPKLYSLYALVSGYALFVFVVSLLLALVTTNPYSATGWTLILLFGTNLIPLVWIPLFTGNVLDRGSAFLFDLSPFVAFYALARPGDPFPFSRFENDEPKQFDHFPGWEAFTSFHLVLGLLALVVVVVLARRELVALRARTQEVAQ